MSILWLGRPSNSREDLRLLNRLAQNYGLIEIGRPERGNHGAEPSSVEAIPEYADLILEVLEKLGIEYAVALDGTGGGRLGRELAAVFPGLVGLVVVDAEAPSGKDSVSGAERDMSETGTSLLRMTAFDESVLEDFLGAMEIRIAELSASPPLWYGG